MNSILRRKVQRAAVMPGADGSPGADRAWRLALARAAQDRMALALDVTRLSLHRRDLSEVLELPPDKAFMAVLEGPGDALGLIVLSAPVLAAFIEAQTMGRVSSQPLQSRRPTRIDAAMVAGVIDSALEQLDLALAEEADLIWAGGFRYASFLEETRPLGLLLEDIAYRVLTAEVSLAAGARVGQVLLVLPAEGRAQIPVSAAAVAETAPVPLFAETLAEAVMGAEAALDGVIARINLPLRSVMALEVGEVVPLGHAQIDRVLLEGVDGRPMGTARLGQNRGMRALRMTAAGADAVSPVTERLATGTG